MSFYRTLMKQEKRGILDVHFKNEKKRHHFFLILMSAIVPLLILVPAMIYCGIFPFGENTTLAVDLRNQYVGFFEAFKHIFDDPSSFAYNFAKGPGGNMIGTFAYYLLSPFNFLLFAFSDTNLPFGILLIQMIKVSLSGAFFAFYLIKREHGEGWGVLLFSVLYATMGFTVANLLNLMWFDPIYMAPILLWLLERMLDGKSAIPYVFALAATIFTNFYMSYMLCFFLVFYTIWTLIRRARPSGYTKKEWMGECVRKFFRFALVSVIAAALVAWLVLPDLYSLMISKGPYQDPQKFQWTLGYPLFDPLSRLLPAANDYKQVQNGYAVIFSGTITVIFGLFYLLNRRITLREKIASIVFCAFLLLSMNVKFLNLIWHGLQYPIWYNFRFSWVFSLFALILGYRSFRRTRQIRWFQYLLVLVSYAGLLCYLLYKVMKQSGEKGPLPFLTYWHIAATAAIVLLYLLLLHRWRKKPTSRLAVAGILMLTFIEMATNAGFYMGVYNYEPIAEFHFIDAAMRDPSKKIAPQENTFYRVERLFRHDRNDGMRFGLSGLTHFNSTYENHTIELFSRLGLARARASSDGGNTTKLTDALFGVKYYMEGKMDAAQKTSQPGMSKLENTIHRPDIKNMILQDESRWVKTYENPWAMPLGMLAEKEISTYDSGRKNPMDFQDDLANMLDGKVGTINYFTRQTMSEARTENLRAVDPNASIVEYKRISTDKKTPARLVFDFETTGEGSFYATISETFNGGNSNVYLNNQRIKNHRTTNVTSSQVLNVSAAGEQPKKQTLAIEMNKEKDSFKLNHMALFMLNEAALQEAVAMQNANGLQLHSFSSTHFEGKIQASEETPYLLLSLPYDEGWNAHVDGAKVVPLNVLDGLTAIPITKGTHTISFSYVPPLMLPGLALTAAGFVCLIVLAVDERKTRKERLRLEEAVRKNRIHSMQIGKQSTHEMDA